MRQRQRCLPPSHHQHPKTSSRKTLVRYDSVSLSLFQEPVCGKCQLDLLVLLQKWEQFEGSAGRWGEHRPPNLQSLSDCSFKLFHIWDQFSASCDLLLFHNLLVIKQLSWQGCWETWHGVLRAGRLRYVSAWCYWNSVLTRVSWHGEYDKILNNKRSCECLKGIRKK